MKKKVSISSFITHNLFFPIEIVEPVKQLSKKEKKKKEQEEFDALMNEIGVADNKNQEETKEKTESKQETQAEIDEKKREANRKKKERQKAKKAEAAKQAKDDNKKDEDLTEEQKQEAIAEALRKRQQKGGAGRVIDANIAQQEAANRKGKQGTKKNKSGYGR